MNETEFNQYCDDVMLAIEEVIDQANDDGVAEIDYENAAGVLTLTMEENNSQIIVSRQPALNQIWVAAKSGGYYFDFSGEEQWICTTTKESLAELLQRVCLEQQGGDVPFSDTL